MSNGFIVVGIISSPFWVIGLLVAWLGAATCSAQATKMGFESSWGPLQDCMIKVNGRFVPLSAYKVIQPHP